MCWLMVKCSMCHRFAVEAVDTTGAGDCFNGALAVALARGLKMVEAVQYANAAAALAVTRFGAQASMPTDDEVQIFAGTSSSVTNMTAIFFSICIGLSVEPLRHLGHDVFSQYR